MFTFTKEDLEKMFEQISKRQVLTIATLLAVPGGIPVLIYIYYRKYKHHLDDFELIIKRKDEET